MLGQRDTSVQYVNSSSRRSYFCRYINANQCHVVYKCQGNTFLVGRFGVRDNGVCNVPDESYIIEAVSFDESGKKSGEIKSGQGVMNVATCHGDFNSVHVKDFQVQ